MGSTYRPIDISSYRVCKCVWYILYIYIYLIFISLFGIYYTICFVQITF